MVPAPEEVVGTCVACGLVYHEACAAKERRCLRSTCLQHRPNHVRWTVEARAKGLWKLLPAPAPPRALLPLMAVCCFPPMLCAMPDILISIATLIGKYFPDLPRWMIASGLAALLGVPCLIVVALWHQFSQYRPTLIDDDGLWLGFNERWCGTRLRWKELAGYKIRTRGIELVIASRPWTRWVMAPMLVCEDRVAHDVTELLEQHGLVNVET